MISGFKTTLSSSLGFISRIFYLSKFPTHTWGKTKGLGEGMKNEKHDRPRLCISLLYPKANIRLYLTTQVLKDLVEQGYKQ